MTRGQLRAFLEGAKNGKRKTQRHKIYNAIKDHNAHTLDDIHRQCWNMKMASVSGRVSELLDAGLIWEGKAGQFWHTKTFEHAEEQCERRNRERYEKWKTLGDREGFWAVFRNEMGR